MKPFIYLFNLCTTLAIGIVIGFLWLNHDSLISHLQSTSAFVDCAADPKDKETPKPISSNQASLETAANLAAPNQETTTLPMLSTTAPDETKNVVLDQAADDVSIHTIPQTILPTENIEPTNSPAPSEAVAKNTEPANSLLPEGPITLNPETYPKAEAKQSEDFIATKEPKTELITNTNSTNTSEPVLTSNSEVTITKAPKAESNTTSDQADESEPVLTPNPKIIITNAPKTESDPEPTLKTPALDAPTTEKTSETTKNQDIDDHNQTLNEPNIADLS
jgi:hypothetical protein